jgi:hypothetical protein
VCISLQAAQQTWNLQAPTAEIASVWISAVHQLVLKSGRKVVSQVHADLSSPVKPALALVAEPALASPSPVCPAPAVQQGRALPARRRSANHHSSGTINRLDPTELFDLQFQIGAGSFGQVFLAVDRRDFCQVAIKVIPAKRRHTANLRKEIHILKQCRSPYIVGYKGAFHKKGSVWIVME